MILTECDHDPVFEWDQLSGDAAREAGHAPHRLARARAVSLVAAHGAPLGGVPARRGGVRVGLASRARSSHVASLATLVVACPCRIAASLHRTRTDAGAAASALQLHGAEGAS